MNYVGYYDFVQDLIESQATFEVNWSQELKEIEPTEPDHLGVRWRQYKRTGKWWMFVEVDES